MSEQLEKEFERMVKINKNLLNRIYQFEKFIDEVGCFTEMPCCGGVDVENLNNALSGTSEVFIKYISEFEDNKNIDEFSQEMKSKMKKSLDKGRFGWHNKQLCSGKDLAGALVEHLYKDNEGNFVDIANYCMMLHQRGECPSVIKEALGDGGY